MNDQRITRLVSVGLGLILLALGLACQALRPPRALHTTLTPPPAEIHSTLQPEDGDGTPSSEEEIQARRERIFHRVWRLVDRNYVYPDYRGVDWEAVWDEFTPRVKQVRSDEEFYDLMKAMIDRLEDHHSAFLTPEEVAQEDQERQGNLDYVGIGVYITVPEGKDYGVVLFTFPESPAATAGILPHERILAIDGTPACCTPEGFDNLDLLQGEPASQVQVEIQTPEGVTRTLEITRARIQTRLPVPARRIPTTRGEVGYLLIPTLFDDGIAQEVRAQFQALLDEGPLVGLIIDMRINSGGAYIELADLLSLFTKGKLGTFNSRGEMGDEPLELVANPIGPSQTLPLVILVGQETESYAEVFSGVLQEVGRARLVGEPTAGNVESIYPYDLEDGSRLWLAQETFTPPQGTRWEGVGVQPDQRVPGAWEDYSETNDPQLEAALELLK